MSIKEKIIQIIEHNPNHYIELNIFGKKIKPCARCFGKYIGIVTTLPLALLFIFGFLKADFTISFIVSWLLAIPAIIDWITVKTKKRDGNNRTRVASGFLLGVGIATYFLIMETSLIFKLVTFMIYSIIFALIRIYFMYEGFENFFYHIRKSIENSRKVYTYSCCGCEAGCCCSLFDGCFATCLNAGICVCVTIIAIPFCCCISKMLCGGEKNGK